jgi:hypothetical protein
MPQLQAPLAALVAPFADARGLDWESLGLVLCVLGCFLLANGVLLRDPRSLLAQRLARAAPPLRTLRELVFQRVQTGLGLLFLSGGFVVQLLGRAAPQGAEPDLPGSIALWVGLIVLVGLALELCGWWWSLFSFRRQVGRFLRADPPDLSADMILARELGELFGVHSHETDTVQSYLERVHAAIGLGPPRAVARRRPSGAQAEFEPEPELDDPDLEPRPRGRKLELPRGS